MEPNVNIDFVNAAGDAQGDLGRLLTQGQIDPGQMRPFIGSDNKAYMTLYKGGAITDPTSYKSIQTNSAVLRRDEWKQLDDAIVPIAEYRLGATQDIISRGLVYNLGNAMGTTVLEWHDVSDAMEATLSMDGVTRGQGDRPTFGTKYLPIPIIHVDYEINARVLAASRSLGNPLDTTSAERAARRVAEKLEKMLFTNETYSFGGGTIRSFTNYSDRNTMSLTADWTDSAMTGEKIVADVLRMKQESIDNYHYGPWMLYIPTAYETLLDEDYNTTRGNTTRERIMSISGILGIKVVDVLTANNVLLVQMTSDVVRIVRGMGLQNIQWETEGKFITKFKVITIQVPQIRSDQNGKCGIVHAT